MSHSVRFFRLCMVALLIAGLTGATSALPGGAQSEGGTRLDVTVPTQLFPNSLLPIHRIIYIWTAVSGATQYQLQVYQGASAILDSAYGATACVSGTCSVRHEVDLNNGDYNWRVRALVGGAWQAYTPWQGFSVSVNNTGFNSPFTSEADGWVVHKGTWALESSNYYSTLGVSGKAATISHINDYTTLTYEVRMKRTGCAGCANVIAIRGNPALDATGWWNTEYTFDYTNTGLFSVWRDSYGTYTALKNWTSSAAIVRGGWNVLKVTADSSTLKFYINGTLVWSGVDSSYPSGRVGIGMYRDTLSSGNKLFVDYAKLDTLVTTTASEINVPVEGGTEVAGGNRNMAP